MLPPPLPPLPYTTSPVRSTWVAAEDLEPEPVAGDKVVELVEHVRARRVTEVYLEARLGGSGALPAEVARACRLLRVRRTYVAALGGETAWLAESSVLPSLWVRSALGGAPFHRVHLDLAPWDLPAWGHDRAPLWGGYLAVLDSVRAAARGVPVDVDVPWWFATESDDAGRPLLDAVLDRAARVTVLVDASRSDGAFGIIARTMPAAQRCDARRKGFSVGVRAGAPFATPGVFADDAALEREAAAVRAVMRGSTGYRGFAVHNYRSWRGLLEGGRRMVGSASAAF